MRDQMIPSARRLMHSLRDMGYELPAAVADLLDNSIDAGSTQVRVDLHTDWRGAYLRVIDNGAGMTDRVLDEAMRYGSNRSYSGEELGNFGLGLKTASLSHARRLTVATRTTTKGPIRIRRWDLDHVTRSDSWMLERPGRRQVRPELIDPLRSQAGTVVMWEKLDRILGSRRPDGDAASRKVDQVTEDLKMHLAMTFHRFLSGLPDGRRIRLLVNEEELHPWDPYALSEPATQRLSPQLLSFQQDGRDHVVSVSPFVLPQQHQFTTGDAHARAAGPNRWNRHQGLYIYRRDRLIQGGGWNRLRTMDEHSKLARIALDIPSNADAAFRVNVAKMSVGIPDDLRTQLRVVIAGVVAAAQDAYRRPRLAVVGGDDVRPAASLTLGDQWSTIVDVLERELADQPELLDRVLVSLVNARPGVHDDRSLRAG